MAGKTHNDMHVDPDLAAASPEARALLLDEKQHQEAFEKHECEAVYCKRWFDRLGVGSLSAAVIVLIVSLGAVWWEWAEGEKIPDPLWWALAGLALVSVIAPLLSHGLHLKDRWLQACYARERIRGWRFQQFLDGALFATGDLRKELASRWKPVDLCLADAPQTRGCLVRLLEDPAECRIDIKRREYPDASSSAVFDRVYELYLYYRVDWQAKHFAFKDDQLKSLDETTSALSKSLLYGSALLTLIDGAGVFLQITPASHVLVFIAAIAAILSAGVRAFRSGTRASEERQHYRGMRLHIDTIRRAMDRARDQKEKLQLMEDVEKLCVDELRGFLLIASKADYFI